MTDPTTTRVITDHVREEARKWRKLSDEMDGINKGTVGNGGLALGASAFFIGPSELVATTTHSTAYNTYYEHVQKLVSGAVVEWNQLGGALDRMADEFDRTDQTAKADLEKIYTQP